MNATPAPDRSRLSMPSQMPETPPVPLDEACARSIASLGGIGLELVEVLNNIEINLNLMATYFRRKGIEEQLIEIDEFPSVDPKTADEGDEEIPA